ncbi:hypothetical protein [Candidatus Uabimicrobium amorphum]|uniref:Uncharacterized protein n=1 Tax=Uabimicrobium amorphum TaxID=2596890 RepID=A0A5S9ITN7_UABAM|nr:hypothetical protein [Candidatus Uabimicrobium amorphum]BBM87557.1 hypothetical protein UABAM_05969 [Candidatus Uabimicrobium amorphum]
MISKQQSKVRKLNIMLFAVAFVMIGLGQYIIDRTVNPSFFIYYYATIALITLIAFLLTLYDIVVLRKRLLLLAQEELQQQLGE